jgi:hypothetical protein
MFVILTLNVVEIENNLSISFSAQIPAIAKQITRTALE